MRLGSLVPQPPLAPLQHLVLHPRLHVGVWQRHPRVNTLFWPQEPHLPSAVGPESLSVVSWWRHRPQLRHSSLRACTQGLTSLKTMCRTAHKPRHGRSLRRCRLSPPLQKLPSTVLRHHTRPQPSSCPLLDSPRWPTSTWTRRRRRLLPRPCLTLRPNGTLSGHLRLGLPLRNAQAVKQGPAPPSSRGARRVLTGPPRREKRLRSQATPFLPVQRLPLVLLGVFTPLVLVFFALEWTTNAIVRI